MTKFDKETRHEFLQKNQQTTTTNNKKRTKISLTFLLHCSITSMTPTLGEMQDNNTRTLRALSIYTAWPVNFPFNFPVTLSNYKRDAYFVLLMLKSTELLITNRVREFCYSFD